MRSFVVRRLVVIVSILLTGTAVPVRGQLLAPVEGPPAELERTEVPAAGSAAVELTVRRFGRYAISAASAQGVALTLVRRMSGPGESDGVPGERDGRLDVLLERGRYLVRTEGHAQASGTAALSVVPYEEHNPEPLPELMPLKLVETGLGETGQRSWWLQIGKDDEQPVILEAAGRCLSDLRLWRDGSWLEPVRPETGTVKPETGRPLRLRRIVTTLRPGLYLVTASGGPPEPWPAGGEARPLFLRLGIPQLPATSRQRVAVGPTGLDHWLVPAGTGLVSVDLPERSPLELEATLLGNQTLSERRYGSVTLGPKDRTPSAVIRTPIPGSRMGVVTIRAATGQPYLLTTLRTEDRFKFVRTALVAAVRTGFPADSLPMTGVILDRSGHPVAARTVTVGPDRPWSGRYDMGGAGSVFLWVDHPGTYTLELGGTKTWARIEPFPTPPRPAYRPPESQTGHSTWELEGGLAVLSLFPGIPGIVEIALTPGDMDAAAPAPTPLPDLEAIRSGLAVQFAAFHGNGGEFYRFFTGTIPGVHIGFLVRQRPVTLETPVPLLLEAGEPLRLPVRITEAAVARATTSSGDPVPLSADGSPPARELRLEPGRHELLLSPPPSGGTLCSLEATPVRLLEATPLPPLPPAVLDARPRLPVLRAGAPPMPLQLGHEDHTDLLVEVDRPGFWIARSTGLLDTTGLLTDRTGAGRFEDDDSGPGYNFEIPAALESGLYGLRVATIGSSRGTCGVALVRNDPVDGGEVAPGRDASVRLGPWHGARFAVHVPAAGRYRLEAMTLSGVPACRLEDAAGWPIERVGIPAWFDRRFEAGELTLVVLPAAGERTVLVRLEPVPEPPAFEGHGPHALPFDTTVRHTWREPAAGGERTPDVWTFGLPVPVPVEITLTGGVTGRLLGPSGRPVEGAGRIAAGEPWKGTPPEAGTYRLEVRSGIPNDRLPYTVRVEPGALLPGMARELALPAELTLATPGGVTAIETFSDADTTATLLGPDGTVVARSDDRGDDWNPGFVQPLEAGTYTLRVEPFGTTRKTVRVALSLRKTVEHRPVSPPDHRVLDATGAVHVVPVQASSGSVLLVSASGPVPLGLALERREGDGWRTVAGRSGRTVALEATTGGGPLRLRVWPLVPASGGLELSVAAARPRKAGPGALARGVETAPPPRGPAATAVALADLGSPGVLRLDAPVPGLRAVDREGRPLEPVTGTAIPTATGRLWLATPRATRLRGRRLTLASDRASVPVPRDRTVTVDLEPASGPSVVLARSTAGTVLLAATADGFAACRPGDGVTALVLGPGASRVLLHLADGDGDGGIVTVERRLFGPETRPLAGPAEHLAVPTHGLALELPGGDAAWSLDAGPEVVAAFEDERHGELTVTVPGQPGTVALAGAFGRVLLLPVNGKGGVAALHRLPGDPLPQSVEPGAPAVLAGRDGGLVRLDVEPSTEAVLTAEGAGLTVVTDAGTLSGAGEAVPEPGAAWVEPLEPASAVWFGPPERPATALLTAAADTGPCEPPCRAADPDGVLGLRLEPAEPAVLTVRLPAGTAARLDGAGTAAAWFQAAEGVRHLPVPAGTAVLSVRSLLAGHPARAFVTATPVREAGEGAGEPVVLGPGDAVGFRFTVPERRSIGVGVAAQPDTVTATLLDATGAVAGRGVDQLRELDPGPYVLLVANGGPETVTVRPAIAGLEPPPSGPPEDVVRHYLELSGRSR